MEYPYANQSSDIAYSKSSGLANMRQACDTPKTRTVKDMIVESEKYIANINAELDQLTSTLFGPEPQEAGLCQPPSGDSVESSIRTSTQLLAGIASRLSSINRRLALTPCKP